MKRRALCSLISLLVTLLSQAQIPRGPGRPAPLSSGIPTGQTGKYVALLVGVGRYEDTAFDQLTYPVEDVKTLANLLTNYNFRRPDIITLFDPNEQTFFDTLNKLATTLTPTDNLLIFFSGHGVLIRDRNYYWLAADAQKQSREGWISIPLVLETLGGTDCKHILLIIDSCHGGAIFTQKGPTRDGAATDPLRASLETIRQYGDLKSGEAITSGAPQETVPDKSHFFAALKNALTINPYRYVLSSSLFNYVRERTIAAQSLPSFGGVKVTPQRSKIGYLGDEGGEFVFYKPNGDAPKAPGRTSSPVPVDQTLDVGRGIRELTLRVQPGQTITMRASGSIVAGQHVGTVTPVGKTRYIVFPISHFNIDPNLPHGALLYRLAPEKTWQYCGDSCTFQAPASGEATIQLTVNDNSQEDNSGAFTVQVR